MKIIIIPDDPTLRSRRYRIAESLAEKGHEIPFLVWDFPYHMSGKRLVRHVFTSLLTKEYKYENVTVHKIGRLPYYWPYVNGVLFKHQLTKLYKRIGADIIFTESYTNETEVPKSLPYIYDLADDYAAPADVYGSLIYKIAFKLLGVRATMKHQCQNALAVTVLSDSLYKFAMKYNSKTLKLPDGVERDQIEKVLRDKSTYPKKKYSMVYATGFGTWSRPIETMQAVMELRKEFPAIDLTLIGDGAEAEHIKCFIKENCLEEYIHYLGFIGDRKRFFTLINQNMIGLNISDKNKWRDAAHPLKVLEYCAMGKKVVSTDLAEVVALGFSNIFIFSGTNKDPDLKTTMRKALLYENRENEYSAISSHVLEKYSWDKITDDLIKLIEDLGLSKK